MLTAALPAIQGLWYHNFFTDSGWAVFYDTPGGWVSGNNSVVECDLAKVEVAGSNPVSRSILLITSEHVASAADAILPVRPVSSPPT